MKYDVIVIGGSYAGMAAALQLVRARRTVLVIDKGERRNRFAVYSHGFVSQDGVEAGKIASDARAQLLNYPTLTWVDAMATHVTGEKDAFAVSVSENEKYEGRRVLFATGVRDDLPSIPGMQERWGKHVFHCPYCHGYELNMGPIAVIATCPMSVHQAQLLPEWGQTTFFINGAVVLDEATRFDLATRSVTIVEGAILGLEGAADIRMRDGSLHSFAGIFTASRTRPSSEVASHLGCAIEETPLGTQLRTDDTKETSVPGAYACGDAARTPHSVSLAVGDGAWAGAQLHRSLVF